MTEGIRRKCKTKTKKKENKYKGNDRGRKQLKQKGRAYKNYLGIPNREKKEETRYIKKKNSKMDSLELMTHCMGRDSPKNTGRAIESRSGITGHFSPTCFCLTGSIFRQERGMQLTQWKTTFWFQCSESKKRT